MANPANYSCFRPGLTPEDIKNFLKYFEDEEGGSPLTKQATAELDTVRQAFGCSRAISSQSDLQVADQPGPALWTRWDMAIGSAASGFGYCSKDEPDPNLVAWVGANLDASGPKGDFAKDVCPRVLVAPDKSVGCACRNSPVYQPACFFYPYCTGYNNTYKNYQGVREAIMPKICPNATFYTCQQVVEVQGDNDKVDFSQNMTCGGGAIVTAYRARPASTIALVVLLAAVALLALTVRKLADEEAAAPPADGAQQQALMAELARRGLDGSPAGPPRPQKSPH